MDINLVRDPSRHHRHIQHVEYIASTLGTTTRTRVLTSDQETTKRYVYDRHLVCGPPGLHISAACPELLCPCPRGRRTVCFQRIDEGSPMLLPGNMSNEKRRTLVYNTQQSSHGHNRRERTTCSPSLTRQSPSTPFSLLGTISEWPGRESHPYRHQQCFARRNKIQLRRKGPDQGQGSLTSNHQHHEHISF